MYVTVVIPSTPESFTYEAPAELAIGDLVAVPFRSRTLHGLVVATTADTPPYATKPIEQIIRRSVLTEWQVATATWMAEYYHGHIGKTFSLFAPERVWSDTPIKRKTKLPTITPHSRTEWVLNADQQAAIELITKNSKLETNNFLLHGITGSGKTEVYLRAIQHTLASGKQAIFLVPEIALTPQLTGYLASAIDPEKIAVIHSQLAAGHRLALWEKIHAGDIQLVIGSRSALFAPTRDLGLIILDEEHEWTYKNDQAPRYHARAVAQKMAELTGATLVLGSATPSLESFTAAKAGRIALIDMPRRVDNIPLPAVSVVDLRQELKKQNYSIFSELLTEKITDTLARGEQVMLFLNKRGYASSLVCRDCGAVVECPHCAIPLTLHRFGGEKLLCHFCGHIARAPKACPTCGGLRIRELGTGTQKLEGELATHFPTARVLRADRDTTTAVGSHQKIYDAFKNHEADILVGTQMIAKGWDLPNVTLVGVLLADIGLHLPDFRAGERTFSLLTQMAGRAGRREKPGEVVIQTYSPDSPAIQAASRHDYATMYAAEIAERKAYRYPPFTRIVKFAFVDRSEKVAREKARAFAEQLKQRTDAPPGRLYPHSSVTVAPALIAKIHDKYHYHVIWRGRDPSRLWDGIVIPDGCRVDVDPVSIV